MRSEIYCYINGVKHQVEGSHAFWTVSDYLRYQESLTGTKVVCAEGDCGACTVLVSRLKSGELQNYKTFNSCILFMFMLDGCHIITVEGLGNSQSLSEVQLEMIQNHGAQCGYCTPGFICSLSSLANDLKKYDKRNTEQKIKNYLTGNLCRCTGYEPIINAAKAINKEKVNLLSSLYNDSHISNELLNLCTDSISLEYEDKRLFLPQSFTEAAGLKSKYPDARIISGATDLGVLKNKARIDFYNVISLNNIEEAYTLSEDVDVLAVGAKVSYHDLEVGIKKMYPDFSRLLHIFASPQIKNSGTLVGNLVNASPIGDTIPFLLVVNANVELISSARIRTIPIRDFIKDGYKNLDIKANEIVTRILIPKKDGEVKTYKVSIRKDLDISTVTMAVHFKLIGSQIEFLEVAFGGVGPRVVFSKKIAKACKNKEFDQELFSQLVDLVPAEITPLSDHRGSKDFRILLCQNLLLKFSDEVIIENGLSFSKANI